MTSLERTSSMEARISRTIAECGRRVTKEIQVTIDGIMKEVGTRLETASKERSEPIPPLHDVLNCMSSSSHVDNLLDPSMFQDIACKSVDEATDALAEILLKSSTTKSCDVEGIAGRCIIPAKLGQFSKHLRKYFAWSHRICSVMFSGFEHCNFDIDSEQLTSPLDAQSFEYFQLKQAITSLDFFNTCDTFRNFFQVKYAALLPPSLSDDDFSFDDLIDVAHEFKNGISFDDCVELLGFDRVRKFYGFLDVAKAVWLLHKLAFAFEPPVSILRMVCGEAFDQQFHEPLGHDEDRGGGWSKVVLMIRPAFRVRNTLNVRSRVLLKNV